MLRSLGSETTPHDGEQVRRVAQGHHRSEEHTSELQSLAYLVCRLLLEKKKNVLQRQLPFRGVEAAADHHGICRLSLARLALGVDVLLALPQVRQALRAQNVMGCPAGYA